MRLLRPLSWRLALRGRSWADCFGSVVAHLIQILVPVVAYGVSMDISSLAGLVCLYFLIQIIVG